MILQFDMLVESILHSSVPQLVIDSMMEGRPSQISEEDFLKTTLKRLKGIVWSGPIKTTIPLKSLAVLHPIYHPWFDFTEETQQFVSAFKNAVITGSKLPAKFDFVQKDIDKKYDIHVDQAIEKRPLIVLRKNKQYSIIDGSHRFWGKVAHELQNNSKVQSVEVKAYIGTIK
jgi:hypothetical protein